MTAAVCSKSKYFICATELLKPVTRCDSSDACLIINNVAFNIFILMIKMNHGTDYFLALFFFD